VGLPTKTTTLVKNNVAMHHPNSFGGYRWLYSGESSLEIYPE